MVDFICSVLGLTYSGLSEPLKVVVIVSSCLVVCFFIDTIVRLVMSPVFALFGSGGKHK